MYLKSLSINQSTNGPVNAHLTSRPGFSTINNFDQIWFCHKIGQGQSKVIIYRNFVDLESPIVHAKFQIMGLLVLKKKVLKVLVIHVHVYGHGSHLGNVI